MFVKITGGSHIPQTIHLLNQTPYNCYAVKHNYTIPQNHRFVRKCKFSEP